MYRALRPGFVVLGFLVGPATGCAPPPAECTAPSKLTTYFPANNGIGTWVEDTAVNAAGVELADADTAKAAQITVKKAVENIVDGDANSFTERGMVAFGRENYTDGTAKLELRIWHMPSTDKAKEVYDYTGSSDTHYTGPTWSEVALGDAAREADTGTHWAVNARQCFCQVEVKVSPNDTAGKGKAEEFMQQILAKLPKLE